MADSRALVRVLDEFLWTLRRDGLVVSTSQAIDVARAVAAVGIEVRANVSEAIAAVVVQRLSDRGRFEAAFDSFFASAHLPRDGSLWERLSARGFDDNEIDALRALMRDLREGGADGAGPLGVLLEHGADLDRLLALAGIAGEIDAYSGAQLGFRTHGLNAAIGVDRAHVALAALRSLLADAFGPRGEALADALAEELDGGQRSIQRHVRRSYEERVTELERTRTERRLDTTPFTSLDPAEVEEVRLAVRLFSEKLRGGARLRARRALRGRIDPHRTLRRALRTGGVPFDPARRRRRRDRPKLVLLCDVSDSVRAAACFLLEFTYAAQELFQRARSFVFVSEVAEITELFRREPVSAAVARVWGGGVLRSGDNSNYGRVLRGFAAHHLRDLDRRTTVVILGDGRTNYHDAAAEVLDRIRERSRALIWLCPEPRGQWSQGDSAMATFAPKCTSVYEVRCAADLERAARAIIG